MEKTVYLLEDDTSICELVECGLGLAEVNVKSFNTVAAFEKAVAKNAPSIALLDVMLPDGNGFEVLGRLKIDHPDIICIMLSAMSRESDKVKGLNLGADDYIAKPFGVLELTARINAAFRRLGKSDGLKAGNVVINETNMTVLIGDKPATLSNMEFKLLAYLARNKGAVISREKILNAVWGYEEGTSRTVDIHIARLRKMGVEGIETVFGAGYKFKK